MAKRKRPITRRRDGRGGSGGGPAPDPAYDPGRAAARARELMDLTATYPDEREELLVEAAGEWESAGEPGRALEIYDELLGGACAHPDLVGACRVRALRAAGRPDAARAEAARLRHDHPSDPRVWGIVAGTFRDAGELPDAAAWFTAGITHLLGPGTPPTAAAVDASPHHAALEDLLMGRHLMRRRLGAPHDRADDLAHELHDRTALRLGYRMSLDECHRPDAEGTATGPGTGPETDPETEPETGPWTATGAEPGPDSAPDIDAWRRDLHERAAATAAGGTIASVVTYWPENDYPRLTERFPSLREVYGPSHATHRERVEHELRALSESGARRPGVARAGLTDLDTHLPGIDLNDPAARARYARDLAARGRADPWPPPRNGPCWCGSTRKYKKCCGDPAAG